MCYICSCFGWTLDFIQRAITFVLGCILCSVVTIGVIVAIAAGVAYGYNYSMAEFLTFTSQYLIKLSAITIMLACIVCSMVTFGVIVAIAASVAFGYNYLMAGFLTFTRRDVTVYMRRGQFYDRPEVDLDREYNYRRSEGEDTFSANKSADYQDRNISTNIKSVPDTWSDVKTTRSYAKELTKYSNTREESEEVFVPDESAPEKLQPDMPKIRLYAAPTPQPRLTLPPRRPSEPQLEVVDVSSDEELPVKTSTGADIENDKELFLQPVSRVFVSPKPSAATMMESGFSETVMRQLQPLRQDGDHTGNLEAREFYYDVEPSKVNAIPLKQDSFKGKQYYNDARFRIGDSFPLQRNRPTMKPLSEVQGDMYQKIKPESSGNQWGMKSAAPSSDYKETEEDLDEDNLVYRPVR